MFKRKVAQVATTKSLLSTRQASRAVIEGLEDRRLMSGGPHGFGAAHFGFGGGGRGRGGDDGGHGRGGPQQATITLTQAPGLVQSGLATLAGAATLPTTVYLGNSNGVETYTVFVPGTGTTTKLTVDQGGFAVTPPTVTSTTLADVTLPSAVTTAFTNIASGLGFTTPLDTATTVKISTPTTGPAIYTIRLSSTTTSAYGWHHDDGAVISVDALGNPVGNERVPLSALSGSLQTAFLVTNLPAGATPLTLASLIDVRTVDGVKFYSAKYTAAGIQTSVTLNAAGVPTTPTATTPVVYSDLAVTLMAPLAAAELQVLATADGAGTILGTQAVTEITEANGTVLFSVKLPVTATNSNGGTYTYNVTLTVDKLGNPTVLPFGGFGGDHGRGGCGGD